MEHENAFVLRRQIVELPESVPELGERMRRDGPLAALDIPGFDGETYTMDVNARQTETVVQGAGVIMGSIRGEAMSDVVLGYHEDATSGYVNIPSQGRVLEYMTAGRRRIVIKDIDAEARAVAEPCSICAQAGHTHADHVDDAGESEPDPVGTTEEP